MHPTHSLNILMHLTHHQAKDLRREICFRFCYVVAVFFNLYTYTRCNKYTKIYCGIHGHFLETIKTQE